MSESNADAIEHAEAKTYGGCEGPDSEYVKLISSDGHEFILKREHAYTSGVIKNMLCGPGLFQEKDISEVTFSQIPSGVLQQMCLYFVYKACYTNSATEIPDFKMEPEMTLELLMAAMFFNC